MNFDSDSFKADKRSFIQYAEQSGGYNNFNRREVSVDNRLIELFFADFEGLYANQEHTDDYEIKKRIEEIKYIIDNMLPEIEKQVIVMFFYLKRKQETIGRILHVSQEMICYYKNRALTRIKMMHFFRNINIEDMENFLTKHVTKKQKTAMVEYFKVHDMRKIAVKIAKMEGKKFIPYEAIGSRFRLGLKKMKELTLSYDNYVADQSKMYLKVFTLLRKYNSLYHTQSKKPVLPEIDVS
jgi:hypothetical protein